MSDAIIQVRNLGKQYAIGGLEKGYRTLRDVISSAAAPLNWLKNRAHHNRPRDFWALRHITFDVPQGEVLGIIGRNGAGKSTLLKILSRVTHPTEGEADICGRVGSLLEVGTGFHPELTGRENVFLNGAVLGMKRVEIQRKFDEIVAFAEVEQFLDTPVKHYSSGMYMRLAFAVAAHLEPEILMIDEVLAVGDAAFQKKCLGKMGEVAHQGRTVLFVSHNLAAIQRLCNQAILLEAGHLRAYSASSHVIQEYLKKEAPIEQRWERSFPSKHPVSFQRIYLRDESDREVDYITTSISLRVVMEFTLQQRCRGLQVSLDLLNNDGDLIFASNPQDTGFEPPEEPGQYTAVVEFPPEIFLAKVYRIRANLWTTWDGILDSVDQVHFVVHETASSSAVPEGKPGQLLIPCKWQIASQTAPNAPPLRVRL